MNLLTNVKLFESMPQNWKHSSHLKKPNFTQFLKICQSHQQIVTSFSSSPTCKKSCLVCPECRKHRNQQFKIYEKHTSLDLKSFVNLIDVVKNGYSTFHHVYTNEVMPIFLKNLKLVILEFFREFEKRDEETVLLQNFLATHRITNKKIMQLLNQDIDDWDLTDFSCADLGELASLKERVSAKSYENLKENIWDDMKGLLRRVLAHYGLIPIEKTNNKQQLLIQGELEQVRKKLKQIEFKTQTQLKNMKNFETLSLQLINKNDENPFLKFVQNSKQTKPLQDNQQQQNQKLGLMLEQLIKYIQTCKHKFIKLNFNVQLQNTQFWQFLLDKLINLDKQIGSDKKFKIEEIVIYCNQISRLQEMFDDLAKKSMVSFGLLQLKIDKTPDLSEKSSGVKLKNFNIKFKTIFYSKKINNP